MTFTYRGTPAFVSQLPDLAVVIVTVPTAVQSLSDDLLKYYQQITRAILGDDPHLMKVEHKQLF